MLRRDVKADARSLSEIQHRRGQRMGLGFQRLRQRRTALLVADEELVRMSTADMLNDFGFEVIEAGSAEEALSLTKAGTVPALLVTDSLMPGMSGADLAREVRTRSRRILALSSDCTMQRTRS